MASPIDLFFKMGDKATRGDPRRQQDFTYYMLWILFLAFSFMFLNNIYHLIVTPSASYAIWSMIGFAVAGLQFFSLKSVYELRKIRQNRGLLPQNKPKLEVESVEEMMNGFQNSNNKKEVKIR